MTSIIRTTLLLASLTGLMLLIGGVLGGRSGMLFALLISLVMNLGTYWYSDKIVLRMYHAKEIAPAESPELYRIVQDLVDRAGTPMPKVYIVNTQMPNAFATGRDPKHAAVAVTTGILNILNRDELEGVIAHELAHVKNRDTLISAMAATIAGVITFMANMAQWSLIFGGGDDDNGSNIIGVLAMAILAPIAALIIQLAISRSREFGADEGGAKLCGKPLALASALAKLDNAAGTIRADVNPSTAHMFIINPLKRGNIASLFSTHPSTEERIKTIAYDALSVKRLILMAVSNPRLICVLRQFTAFKSLPYSGSILLPSNSGCTAMGSTTIWTDSILGSSLALACFLYSLSSLICSSTTISDSSTPKTYEEVFEK